MRTIDCFETVSSLYSKARAAVRSARYGRQIGDLGHMRRSLQEARAYRDRARLRRDVDF